MKPLIKKGSDTKYADYNFGFCSTTEEVDRALDFVSRVLGPSIYKANERFKHAYQIDSQLIPERVLTSSKDGQIIGSLFISQRRLNLRGRPIDASGITNVCVHPQFQGIGLGRELTEIAVQAGTELDSIMSVLFARKAVDGFYEKLGFLGTGLFIEMVVDLAHGHGELTEKLEIAPGINKDSAQIHGKMYAQTYRNIPLSFIRGTDWWQTLEEQLRYKVEPEEFMNVSERDGAPAGYFIYKDDKVIEAACRHERLAAFCDTLIGFARSRGSLGLTLSVHQEHPCVQYLYSYNHIMTARRAWDGGHMIRILDPSGFQQVLEKYASEKYADMISSDMMSRALDRLAKSVAKYDCTDHEQARQMLGEVCAPSDDAVLHDVSSLFRHTWSLIDEF